MTRADLLALEPGGRRYPPELERLVPPPERIWLRGLPLVLDVAPRIAVVGSRSPTPYGEAQAERFASAFAAAGACVVSGLARGVDQTAHRAALDAGGATLAVLGSGVDRPWPSGPVPDAVLERGLLLSEFPPGQGPRPHHFPLRNRLIAGLSRAVLVVEAARASGSLITARWAADQGVDVWAVPGRVDHPMAAGCHRLLREGARLAEDPDELLGELGAARPEPLAATGEAPASPLVDALVGETLTAEELAGRTGLALPKVLAELALLELGERVVRAPGGLYRLAARR